MSIQAFVKACDFACVKHTAQRRKGYGGEVPYINHPVGVAALLADAGVDDVATLQGAVLHDTVEDTDCTLDEIEQHFGAEVRQIVDDVSDDKGLDKAARKRGQIAHAGHIGTKSKLVKLADKLYNLRDLTTSIPPGWDRARAQGYFVWGKAVVDQMRGTNSKLEAQLDEVFAGTFRFGDEEVPAVPNDADFNELLERYLKSMEGDHTD